MNIIKHPHQDLMADAKRESEVAETPEGQALLNALTDAAGAYLGAGFAPAAASAGVAVLENHGWLVRLPGGCVVNGAKRVDVWKLRKR